MPLTEDSRKNARLIMMTLLAVGIMFISKSVGELIILNSLQIKGLSGTLNSYHFEELDRGVYDYMIFLNESDDGFQITADLVDYFRKDMFEGLKPNDRLYIEYVEMPTFFGEKRNELIGVSSLSRVFLVSDDSIKVLSKENTFGIGYGLIFLAVSLILRKVLKNDRAEQLHESRHIS